MDSEKAAVLKKRVKAAAAHGRLDLSSSPYCRFDLKKVPSAVYQAFGETDGGADAHGGRAGAAANRSSSNKADGKADGKTAAGKRRQRAAAAASASASSSSSSSASSSSSSSSSSAGPASTSASGTALRELWLSKNAISLLTREIYSLPHLTTLCLSSNNLTGIPSNIGDLSSLQRLILDGNKITSVPPDIARLSALRELRLDKNRLSEFPLVLTELTALIRLGLSHNKIGPTIPAQVRRLAHLIELDLDHNAITGLPRTMVFMQRSLQQLGLAFNRLGAVPDVVAELGNLDVLRTEGNRAYEETDAATGETRTVYTIPTRHDGYPELRTGENVVHDDGTEEHVVHKLPGYLESSFVQNTSNANWLRADDCVAAQVLRGRAKARRKRRQEAEQKRRAELGSM